MIVGTPNFDEALVFGEIKVGLVLTAVVNSLLTAAVIYFFMVRPMNKIMERAKKKEEAAPEAPPEPSEDVVLLREIRDALKK